MGNGIFIFGTHEYQKYLFPFSYLFKKYWGNEKIIYIGDRQDGPLPDNIEFRQVPGFAEGVWPWDHHFSNGLLNLFNIITDEIIAIFLPDHWLNKPVDLKGVKVLKQYMQKHPNVIRGNLTAGTMYDGYGQEIDRINGYSITSIPSNHINAGLEGGITFCPSLWNVKLLQDVLEPGWDLWACEKTGSDKMKHYQQDLMTVGTRPALLHRTHALYHGNRTRISFDGLNEEDIKTIKECLWIKC